MPLQPLRSAASGGRPAQGAGSHRPAAADLAGAVPDPVPAAGGDHRLAAGSGKSPRRSAICRRAGGSAPGGAGKGSPGCFRCPAGAAGREVCQSPQPGNLRRKAASPAGLPSPVERSPAAEEPSAPCPGGSPCSCPLSGLERRGCHGDGRPGRCRLSGSPEKKRPDSLPDSGHSGLCRRRVDAVLPAVAGGVDRTGAVLCAQPSVWPEPEEKGTAGADL